MSILRGRTTSRAYFTGMIMSSIEELSKYALSIDNIDTAEEPSWKHPHAFHLNLPPNHIDKDGIPYITKYA